MVKRKLVVLTGAGMSAESGISTFRDSGGLWEQYPVMEVASHTGWERDPELVNRFYNERRKQLLTCAPNKGHLLLAQMEQDWDVSIITQNVDDLHEKAGSTHVIHLHGELMKVTSSLHPDDPQLIETMDEARWEVQPHERAKDGSLLRPYIVFFEEAVPKISEAAQTTSTADVFVIIGTSLNVYPAAGLIHYAPHGIPIYLIDPKEVATPPDLNVTFIQSGASEGVARLIELLKG